MKIIPYVLKYARKCLPDVIRLAFCCVILYSAAMISPYITGKYVDGLVSATDPDTIWICVGILAAIWTLQVILSYFKNLSFAKASSRVSYYIEEDLIEHVKRLPLSFFAENEGTYVGHRITTDSLTVAQFVLYTVVSLATDILSLAVSLIAVVLISPYVFLIIVAASPLYAVVYFKFRKPLYELSYACREQENRFFSKVNRQLTNIKPVKQHVYYERLHDEMRASYDDLYEATIKNTRFGYLFGNVESFLRYIITLVVFVFSGYGILNGKMSVGGFTMINTYTVMAISAMSGILGFGRCYRETLVSYDRINDLYTLKAEHNGSLDIGKIESIQLDTLSFGFDERILFDNVNCMMTKGNIYGFVGANGSGKTTLADLITGVIDGYSGVIRYNGVDLKDIDIYELRRKRIAIVEQEPLLLINSIEDLRAEFCGETTAHHWLDRLGMHTVDERLRDMDPDAEFAITVFSGGEKQKLALARALTKDADVLILDEPSSAIDSSSLEQLIAIIKEQSQEKIVILITHEPRLIDICKETIRL